ncbi:transmembrane 9 superfamily member 5 [Andrographis paniculata]|uniref:transmembrane 9 superfamily member 5 n=1 Tax=Andrographis paniculata TaxID=175694 RepID=UPI0021E97D67|nr:transmembrane 9 superfamily member 5 [Andrographis paniculata]
MKIVKTLYVSSLLLLLSKVLHCADSYNVGDPVPFFVNKIGPLHNPSETYQYYELPFCHPGRVLEKKESFGELLNGDRMANALYKLEFAVNKTGENLCHKKLSKDDVAKFRDAIKKDYYFQMYYDELPLWAFIGKVEDDNTGPKYFLFTHVNFYALYNGNHVIEIHALSDPNRAVDVTEDAALEVEFSYSVFWSETSTPYMNRMARYSRASLHPVLQKIHWYSFANSIITVILLTGLLTMLFTRHLKNDLRKWSIGDEEEDEVGRKYNSVHALVCPKNIPLFSAVMGCGTQLLTLVILLFFLALLGAIYPYSHGLISTYTFTSYILTSAIAGYTSASFCSQHAETGWKWSAVLSGMLFIVPFTVAAFFLNTLATYFGVTSALPLGTIFLILLIYFFVALPLLVFGGVIGHRHKSDLHVPPVAKKYAKEVPSLAWYRKTPAQMFIGGLLPFSVVVMQLHNLCSTIWGYKVYTSPGILFGTFTALVATTALLSICLTYFQLAGDNHDWWWRSILSGGSTGIFMFAYCIYFYLKSSDMRGALQASFFLVYSGCLCYAFFLMLGTVSFQASLLFVRRLCRAGKNE